MRFAFLQLQGESSTLIAVAIQDACFRVFEQFQFKASQCSHGYSITN